MKFVYEKICLVTCILILLLSGYNYYMFTALCKYASRIWCDQSDMLQLSRNVKLVVFVPKTHADAVRQVMGKAGAGIMGNYAFCTVSSECKGRWLALEGSHPVNGNIGDLQEAVEERIETICPKNQVLQILREIKKVHPYHEMGYDIYPLLERVDKI